MITLKSLIIIFIIYIVVVKKRSCVKLHQKYITRQKNYSVMIYKNFNILKFKKSERINYMILFYLLFLEHSFEANKILFC